MRECAHKRGVSLTNESVTVCNVEIRHAGYFPDSAFLWNVAMLGQMSGEWEHYFEKKTENIPQLFDMEMSNIVIKI